MSDRLTDGLTDCVSSAAATSGCEVIGQRAPTEVGLIVQRARSLVPF